jgi:PAS domain S-box-containing protein
MAERRRRARPASAEEAAAELYRLLVEQMPVGIFQFTPRGEILTCNEAFVALVGGSRADVLAQDARSFFADPADRDRLLAWLTGSDVVECHDLRWRRTDGRLIWVMVTVRRIHGAGGDLLEGIALDVTDRKTAAESTAWLAAIVESSNDAIIGQTLDGVVTSWNAAAERMYGYTRAEMIGRPLALLAPPDRSDEMPAVLARIRRGEHVAHYETVRLTRDGRRLEVSVTCSPVRDASGTIVGASVTARPTSSCRT